MVPVARGSALNKRLLAASTVDDARSGELEPSGRRLLTTVHRGIHQHLHSASGDSFLHLVWNIDISAARASKSRF